MPQAVLPRVLAAVADKFKDKFNLSRPFVEAMWLIAAVSAKLGYHIRVNLADEFP
jgi:hypothetical protein